MEQWNETKVTDGFWYMKAEEAFVLDAIDYKKNKSLEKCDE